MNLTRVALGLFVSGFFGTVSAQTETVLPVNPPTTPPVSIGPVEDPITIPRLPQGHTTLMTGVDIGNGIVPPRPAGRVRVPPLEHVLLLAPEGWAHPIQWTKDGRAIAGATNRSYDIALATASDSGLYAIAGAPFPLVSVGVALNIVAEGNVGNVSSRTELAPGRSVQIVAFSVSGSRPKKLLVRAVGPTLRAFGMTNPVAQPSLRVVDANGKAVATTPGNFVVDSAAFFASVGAFPLSGGERSFALGSFAPGIYSLVVSDDSGQGGTVLVETYEYSQEPGVSG